MQTTPALDRLVSLLEAAPADGVALGNWRWTVRQQLCLIRDQLTAEAQHHDNAWLAARGGAVVRERNTLLGRLALLGPSVLETADVEAVQTQVRRLVGDITRHLQRVSDLAYDDVELEIGGSE